MYKKLIFVKIVSIILAVVMVFNQFIPVSAKESNDRSRISSNMGVNNDSTYQGELDDAILSGTGTFDDPYILNYELAPEFSDYLAECGLNALENSGLNSNSIVSNDNNIEGASTRGVNDYLTGSSHSNQTNGGYWKYSSGGPTSTLYNGNTVFKKVEYLSYNTVVNINAGFSNNTYSNYFKKNLPSIIGLSLSNATSVLTKCGMAANVAKALCHYAGVASTLFSVTLTLSEFATTTMQSVYVDAKNQRKGVVRAQYNVTYQGQWYSYSMNEVWKKYPTAYEPNSAYGTGTYRSY